MTFQCTQQQTRNQLNHTGQGTTASLGKFPTHSNYMTVVGLQPLIGHTVTPFYPKVWICDPGATNYSTLLSSCSQGSVQVGGQVTQTRPVKTPLWGFFFLKLRLENMPEAREETQNQKEKKRCIKELLPCHPEGK